MELDLILTADEEHLIGDDADPIASTITTILAGVAALRTGVVDPEMASQSIGAIGAARMALGGAEDALIRAWSGTVTELASAMGSPRSTAQSRRVAIGERAPTAQERWATGQRVVTMAEVCASCDREATHELLVGGVRLIELCAEHARTKLTELIGRGYDDVGMRRVSVKDAGASAHVVGGNATVGVQATNINGDIRL